jgi:hypothetical protein
MAMTYQVRSVEMWDWYLTAVEMTDILDKSCVMKVVTGKTFLK